VRRAAETHSAAAHPGATAEMWNTATTKVGTATTKVGTAPAKVGAAAHRVWGSAATMATTSAASSRGRECRARQYGSQNNHGRDFEL
jgi:hypothetical protein